MSTWLFSDQCQLVVRPKRYVRMASAPVAKKRNCLTLKKKVEVINYAKKYPKVNIRERGNMFQCGKTHIASILKNQDSLLSMYESNASGSRVHSTAKLRSCEFMEVNTALHEWYFWLVLRISFREARS